jgi:hypothetical protein
VRPGTADVSYCHRPYHLMTVAVITYNRGMSGWEPGATIGGVAGRKPGATIAGVAGREPGATIGGVGGREPGA